MYSSQLPMRFTRSALSSSCIFGVALLSVALLASCDRERELPTRPVPHGLLKKLIPMPASVRPSEAAFAELAAVVPSSAGFFYDQTGNLVVWVSDAAEAADVPTAINRLLAKRAIALSPEKPKMPSTLIRVGSFSFRQLAAWRDTISSYVDNSSAILGVVSLDLDEAANRVTVGVLSSVDQAHLLSTMRQFGIDPNAIRFRIAEGLKLDAGRSAAFKRPARTAATRASTMMSTLDIRNSQSTVIGGLEIGVFPNSGGLGSECTNGFVVQHYSGGVTKNGLLTASHCTETLFGYDGDTVRQNHAGSVVGKEFHDPGPYTCGLFHCRPSDATFIAASNGVSLGLGQVAKWAGGSYDNYTYDNTSSWVVAEAGSQNVYVGTSTSWVGRTTGPEPRFLDRG